MSYFNSPSGRGVVFARSLIPAAASLLLVACGGGGAGDTAVDNGGSSGVHGAGPVSGATGAAADMYVKTLALLTDVGVKGKTIFVAPTGDDRSAGTSIEAPLQTIERALEQAGPGDTIEVRAGTYAPRGNGFSISRSGTPEARIKIKAHNDEKVILDANGKGYALYVNASVGYWVIEGLEMSGGTSYTAKIDGHHVNLVRNDLHGASNDILKLVQTSNDVVIYGNEIHHNNAGPGANAQGIDIVGADRTWVAHNYVHHTASIAMYSKGNARNTIFEYNRVDNIPSRGIMLGQSTDRDLLWDGPYETYDGIIRNNVITNTADACLATASSMNAKIYNNSCFNAAAFSHGAIFLSNESEVATRGVNIEIKNNIVVTNGRPVFKVGPDALASNNDLVLDGNMYWSGASPVTFAAEDRPLGSVTFDAWRQATGKDATSIVADPKFADGARLTLALDSPAIDAGIDTDLVRDDYNQGPRPLGGRTDIGAYEMR